MMKPIPDIISEFKFSHQEMYEQQIVYADPASDNCLKETHNLNTRFFFNKEQTIAYLYGEIERPKLSGIVSEDMVQEILEEIKALSLKVWAYSVFKDGTELITGNHGFMNEPELSDYDIIYGIDYEGMILYDAGEPDVRNVLGTHKWRIEDLEVIKDPRLAYRFADKFKEINKWASQQNLADEIEPLITTASPAPSQQSF